MRWIFQLIIATCIVMAGQKPQTGVCGLDPSTNLEGFGLKIFRVESALYPFVQVYIRTFDQDMNPLINLNHSNIGLMVKGQVYDPLKKQYMIQSIRGRQEALRSIIVIDTSKTMAGPPFLSALKATARFIDAKRPQDQVAILALNDNAEGYSLISNYERDQGTLGRRLADIMAKGEKTKLFDGVAAALQLAGTASAGGTTTNDASYVASTSIILLSDGKDDGSALTREELMTRISSLPVPIPIYSLAYTKVEEKYLNNIIALSKNSFGKYYPIDNSTERMTRCVENIQNIMQSDYVVTFRGYIPVDGNRYTVKVGVEYPSGSGKMRYSSDSFETIALPQIEKVLQLQEKLNMTLPILKDANPYYENKFIQSPGK